MKNYTVIIRNYHNHETREIEVSEKNVQLAHKLALKQTKFEEDIYEMYNKDNDKALAYHLQKGWKE
jgi:hypothetical protein